MATGADVGQRGSAPRPDGADLWPVGDSWRRIVEAGSAREQASSLADDTPGSTGFEVMRPRPSLSVHEPASGARGEDLVAGPPGSALREVFVREMKNLLMSEPDEDGPSGAAREFTERWLASSPAASGWIQSFFLENITDSGLASSILQLVGWLPRRLVNPWGFVMAMAALSQPNIRVRDAAVRARERLGGPTAVQILAAHRETVPWLRRYVAGVISDLQS